MHALHLFSGRQPGLDRSQSVGDACPLRAFEHGVEACRPLGMACSRGVVAEPRMRREEDRHQGESTVDPCERRARPPRRVQRAADSDGLGLRISPWPNDELAATAAQLAPVPGTPLPTVARSARSPASSPTTGTSRRSPSRSRRPSRARSATPASSCKSASTCSRTTWPLCRRGPRRSPGVLAVTTGLRSSRPTLPSFSEFWRLGRKAWPGDGRHAGATLRVIGVDEADQVIAYALTGRAGPTGYLQRLAVRPSHQGQGLGRCLAIDSPALAPPPSPDRVLVNTQVTNERALQPLPEPGLRSRPERVGCAAPPAEWPPSHCGRARVIPRTFALAVGAVVVVVLGLGSARRRRTGAPERPRRAQFACIS